jgi:hypothetical protein
LEGRSARLLSHTPTIRLMRFNFDIDRQILSAEGNPAGVLAGSALDLTHLHVSFTRKGVATELTGPSPKLRFVLKAKGGNDPLAGAGEWDEEEDGFWHARLGLDTDEIAEALGTKDAVTLFGQFALDEDGAGWIRSQVMLVRITRAIYDELDEFPDSLPGPDLYVAERALLHDRVQNLSDAGKLQARQNAGAAAQADLTELLERLLAGTGLLRLLVDSNGQYALGLKNQTNGAYDVLATANNPGGQPTPAIVNLP